MAAESSGGAAGTAGARTGILLQQAWSEASCRRWTQEAFGRGPITIIFKLCAEQAVVGASQGQWIQIGEDKSVF